MKDQEYLAHILAGLVQNVDNVGLERTTDELGVLFTVSLPEVDMGKVIGKAGETAKAIRTLMRAFAYTHKERVNIKFIPLTE